MKTLEKQVLPTTAEWFSTTESLSKNSSVGSLFVSVELPTFINTEHPLPAGLYHVLGNINFQRWKITLGSSSPTPLFQGGGAHTSPVRAIPSSGGRAVGAGVLSSFIQGQKSPSVVTRVILHYFSSDFD